MRPEKPLRAAQEAFLGDLTGRRARTPGERAAVFEAPPEGAVEDRWAVYADGPVARVAESLENDFPALRRILGPGAFRSLAARYVRARPPRSFDLGRAGDRLAPFLEGDPLTERLPFLPDLARLEWAMAETFVAPDAEPLTWSELAVLGAEAVADLPLALRPGTALIRSQWPLHDLWSCRDRPDHEVSVEVEGRAQTVLVWRRGLEARCRPAEDAEARLVETVGPGATLAQLHAGSEGPLEGAAVPRWLELVRRLVDEGVFVRK